MPVDGEITKLREPRTLLFKHIVRKVFLEDWGLKLVALVITFALWFGVTGLSKASKERITVSLSPAVSTDSVITSPIPPDLEIYISGDKRNLDKITSRNDLSASIDLTEMTPGAWTIPLSPETISVNLPQGVTLDRVVPGNMFVRIEAVAEKDVDVKAETAGLPEAGFEVYAATALPPRIRVRGPASVVQNLEYVLTDKVDMTDKKEDFTAKQVLVSAPNPQAAVLNTVVDVYFRIGEKRVERAFSVPVTSEVGKTATFSIYGPKTLVQKAKADQFKVSMYLNDNGEEAPRVLLPAELQDLVEVRNLKVK